MNVEASNAVAASHDAVLHWPTPPFVRAAPVPADARARDCVVELVNGRTLSAELLGFDPDTGRITVAVAGETAAHHLGLDSVRTLRLRLPLQRVRDEGAIRTDDADATPLAEERPFAVRFHDGTSLTGRTLGFVRDANGLFLYLTESGSQHVSRCFVPAQQIDDVQIGPLLGETLEHSGWVSSKVLAAALDKQARLRDQKLGEQLVDHGIVSPELRHALEEQKSRPSMKLGDILMETGLIAPGQLTVALGFQANNRQRRLGDILIEMGAVTMRQVQMAMSQKLGIPFVDAGKFRVDPLALELVGSTFAIRHQVLALLRLGESLVVAVENPLAMDFAQELRFLTKLTIVPVIANPKDLRARIAREYGHAEPPAAPGGHDGDDTQTREGHRSTNLVQINVEELASELARQKPASHQTQESEPDSQVTDNTLVRLLDLGMDPFNFADALIGILSQRLARKLCTKCRKVHVAEDKELQELAREYCAGTKLEPAAAVARWRDTYARDGQLQLHEAAGCDACTGGYKGRIGVYELLSGTPHVKEVIRSRGSVPQVQDAAMEGGMRLLHQDAIEKVLSGVLDLAGARAASS